MTVENFHYLFLLALRSTVRKQTGTLSNLFSFNGFYWVCLQSAAQKLDSLLQRITMAKKAKEAKETNMPITQKNMRHFILEQNPGYVCVVFGIIVPMGLVLVPLCRAAARNIPKLPRRGVWHFLPSYWEKTLFSLCTCPELRQEQQQDANPKRDTCSEA